MALTTQSINKVDEDKTPEYYVGIDSEGKGYLAKKKPVEEIKVEEVKVKKRRGKK